ncbi:type III-A CRISPR-associated RAMP protein Csm5 [Methylovulum psychrotolerans]|nr:type III-A CRISPR-associated RAMP protein Csm5 [Methylovulum psychrotolerans]
MKGKTLSLKVGLEILTPVQCGSGQDLTQDFDYVVENGQVFVVDQERMFTAIASGDKQLDDALLGGECNLSYWVNELAGERYGYALPMLSRTTKTFTKFREHLKDALYQPYIAGSSLKGAITTALLADYLRELPKAIYQELLPNIANKPENTHAAKKLLDTLLGEDPEHNIFRALHVKDVMLRAEDLCLVDIRWLNLTTDSTNKVSAEWRRITGKNFPINEWKKANGIHAEMLKPKSQAQFQLQWDEFLLSDLSTWYTSAHDILPRDFAGLKERLNRHARYRLEQEIKFYHDYGAIKPEQACIKLLSALQNDPDSIYLQLSWGSGWRGMTGDWLEPDLTKEMCQLFGLRKSVLSELPFPKTRRLAVSGEEPKLPLGWVRLFSYSQIEEKLKQEQLKPQTEAALLDAETQQLGYQGLAAELYKKSQTEKWAVKNNSEKFYRAMNTDYLQKIEEEPNPEIKKQAVAIISGLMDTRNKGIMKNPEKKKGKRQDFEYGDNPRNIAIRLNNIKLS